MPPKTTLWPVDPHTKAKHELLRQYLNGWIPVLGSREEKVLFIDGFAGPGRYSGGEDGSPIVALKTLLEHSSFPRMRSTKFMFLFIENDKERLENLKQEVQALIASQVPWPSNVETFFENGQFEKVAGELIHQIDSSPNTRLVSTLAFIDPFGFSGMSMATIRDLLKHPKCELFVNFMTDHIQRFVQFEKVENSMAALFGCNSYLNAPSSGPQRISFLIDLYMQQLQKEAKFNWTQDFGLDTGRGRLGYHLIHATRHRKGAELFRAATWKLDPHDGIEYKEGKAEQAALEPANGRLAPQIFADMQFNFAGQAVEVQDLENYVIDKTRAHPTVLRKHILVPAEKSGGITVSRPGRVGYPNGTIITFP